MPYANDVRRITRALNCLGGAALVLGIVVVVWALWWTHGVDDFRTAVIIAGLGFGLPSVVALTLAWLLEPLTQSAGRPATDAASGARVTPTFATQIGPLSMVYRYLAAAALVAVATAFRMWLNPVLGDTAPFITFFLAVAVAAWIGGFGPAALATALCVVVAWQWILAGHGDLPPDQLGNFVAISVFAATALTIGGITAAMRATSAVAARLSAETSVRNAELQVIQDELRREHERFSVILDAIGDAVVTAASDGTITHMNLAAERLVGWRLREARGYPLATILRMRDVQTRAALPPPSAATDDTAVASGHAAVVLVDRRGGEHVVLPLIAPIADGNGASLGSVVTFRTVVAEASARAR